MGQRRQKLRFELKLPLSFAQVRRGKVILGGSGTTLDIGSGGVLFLINQGKVPQIGAVLRLSIDWPVKLHNGPSLKLVIRAVVARASEHTVAARFIHGWELQLNGKGKEGEGSIRPTLPQAQGRKAPERLGPLPKGAANPQGKPPKEDSQHEQEDRGGVAKE